MDSDSDSHETAASSEPAAADESGPPVVLAVDDQERVAQAFELWLGDDYDVRIATGGEAALDAMDETVDVVLLDRHMPGMLGDEVLDRIREQGYDCRVAMVTGVDPDFDIIDMPFDEYVQKPLDEEKLHATVERLLRLDDYDARVEELYAVVQTRATLEAEMRTAELERSDEYERLTERQAELEAELGDLVSEMDSEAAATLFDSF